MKEETERKMGMEKKKKKGRKGCDLLKAKGTIK